MEPFLKHIAVFVTAFVAVLLLTPLAKRVAPKFGLVDAPSDRRIHNQPIPRSGGLAVFLATHLALLLVFLGPWNYLAGSVQMREWLWVLLGSFLLLIVGIVDDRSDIRAWFKLLGQLGVALLMFFGGFSFETLLGFDLPWIVALGLTLFWFVLLINAFNLIDGMDGACAGLGAISGMGIALLLLFLHRPADALVVLAVVGACVGFLRYNFHPASIFLGDSGSMFIGFVLAAVSLKANIKQSMVVAVLVPLLTVGIPVFDVMMAVWRRVARKLVSMIRQDSLACKVFGPDLDHIHHKLLQKGMSQRKAAIILYIGASCVCLLALSCSLMTAHRVTLLLLCMVVLLHVVVRQLAHVELWTSAQILMQGVRRPRAVVRLMFSIGMDVFILSGTTFFVYGLSDGRKMDPLSLLACVLVPLFTISFFRVYNIAWTRSRPVQFLKLAVELLSGQVAAFALLLLFSPLRDQDLLYAHILHSQGVLLGILGVRAIPLFMMDAGSWLKRFQVGSAQYKTLLVGAGSETLVYLRYAVYQETHHITRRIIGLVDDDPLLLGRTVAGYPVLGGYDRLDSLIKRFSINELIVCHHESGQHYEQLMTLKELHGISVREFKPMLREMGEPDELKPQKEAAE